MAQKIYFASLKGGTGVTACAVGTGLALAARGERVLVVDGDYRCASALCASGAGGLQVYSLSEAKQGACRVKQVIVEHPRSPNFFILPTLGCDDGEYASYAVTEIEQLFDFVLCDGVARTVCNRAAVICEPYTPCIKSAEACINELNDAGYKETGLIVNKVNGGLVYDGKIMPPSDIAKILRVPLYGVIPEDLTMPLGGMRSDSVKAFRMTAARMSGTGKKTYSPVRSYCGVSGYIKRKMRSKI